MEGTQKLPYINACLTCLNTTHAESILMDTEWIKLIEYCTGLMVDLNSRMWKICCQCSEQIRDYAKFKQKCEKSDNFWKSILSGNVICQIGEHDARSADNVKNKDESGPFRTKEPFSNFDTVNNIVCKEETCYDDFDSNTFDNTQDEFMLPECKPEILVSLNYEKDEFKKESITQIDASPDTDKTKLKCDSSKVSWKNRVKIFKKIKRNQVVALSSLPLPEELYYCGLCKMSSSSLDAINKHVLEEHSSKNDLNCKMCDYVGQDFAQMEVHRFSHSPEELKSKWTCHICGFSPVRSAWRTYNFEFHYRKKHLNKKGGLCKLCGKSYDSLRLWRHHEKWHGEEYICDYCGKSFTLKLSLQSHIIALHFTIKDFVCEVCGMAFTRKSNMKFHKQNKHTTTERVSCPHCLQSLKNKNYLNKHILLLHMKHEHKFICDVCSKSYPSQKQLNAHMIWHRGDRPFPCEICGLRFKVKAQLKSHKNTVHAGLRHFKCDLCDRTFSSTTQRKRHYFVHTGVRHGAHECKNCTKFFNSKKQLNKHNLSFHKDILTPQQK